MIFGTANPSSPPSPLTASWIFGLDANGASHPIWGYEVSGQYFEVVSIKPLLGRLLARADDDHPGAAEVAVLSWTAWKNYFNGTLPSSARLSVSTNFAKLLRLQSLDQFKGMDWFRDQFKLEALPMTSQQYL